MPYDVRFQTPFSCIIAGSSNSGKTWLCNEILKHKNLLFDKPPERTFLFYSEYQDIYNQMLQSKAVDELHKGIPPLEELKKMLTPYKKTGSCCVFDDSIHDIQEDISKIFTIYSHHLNCSVFFISQNLFYQNKEYRTMNLNATYCIIMGGFRSRGQILSYAKQISPYRTNYIVDGFTDATKSPYGYLIFDFKQGVADHIRLRTNILPSENPVTVYVQSK